MLEGDCVLFMLSSMHPGKDVTFVTGGIYLGVNCMLDFWVIIIHIIYGTEYIIMAKDDAIVLCMPTRAHRATEGGERACNVHRRQNAECY